MTSNVSDLNPDETRAVMDLLGKAAENGLGVTFTPDDEGWSIGWMSGNGGGDLSSAFDLTTAAKAAVRPLTDLARRMGHRDD